MKKTKDQKEKRNLTKYKHKQVKNKKKDKYISARILKKKSKTSSSFFNVKDVLEDGTLCLKTSEYAKVFQVEALDLSLASSSAKYNFYMGFKRLFHIQDINIRIYKLDEKINLNDNKEYYKNLIKECNNDFRRSFLETKLEEIKNDEQQGNTITSKYYFVIIAKTEKKLKDYCLEVESECNSATPKLSITELSNTLEVYNFLCNLYFTNVDIDNLLYNDVLDLIAPTNLKEKVDSLVIDDIEAQVVTIRNVPSDLNDGFLEDIFNLPNTKACIHVKESMNMNTLINRLDNNFTTAIHNRNTTNKLSQATDNNIYLDNMKELMTQIKTGNEKIKYVNVIVVIYGTKEERKEQEAYLKSLAEQNKIKIDIPKLRQLELWQAFELTNNNVQDYEVYLPALTLSAGFPLTITNHNDVTGYKWGNDLYTGLPVYFNHHFKDETRKASNMAVIGSTGSGKSFTLYKMIMNEIAKGNKVILFDAEDEYKTIVKNLNGQNIDLYSSRNGIINPLQLRFIDEGDKVQEESKKPLATHLSTLEVFFYNTFKSIDERVMVVLLRMVEKLYLSYGISKTTSITELQKLKNTDYPILNDLINYLPIYKKEIINKEELEIMDTLEILLAQFNTSKYEELFNGYTSIDLSNNLICFNLKDLLYSQNQKIISTQLVNTLSHLNNAIVTNKIENDNKSSISNINVIVDEFHLYLKNTTLDVIQSFEQLARRIRKYSGAFIPATQSIRDFEGTDEIHRSATAILNNCEYQLIGGLKEDDLNAYCNLNDKNPLTDTQIEFLKRATQGQFMLAITSAKRIRIKINATNEEIRLMGK